MVSTVIGNKVLKICHNGKQRVKHGHVTKTSLKKHNTDEGTSVGSCDKVVLFLNVFFFFFFKRLTCLLIVCVCFMKSEGLGRVLS